ncbi:hypothetical protein HANVADRAFT_88037 [Hanseniaspora valbyensis NRRL Y-1626]|uniref:Uncharacterized protein n=1 Tax=Hanseniaspora valbyensis NRRL Y-1626 TaxID=766949 RepID=A0A1B7TBW0_9ASCO|nr:hypothetical protein HANVADRAFT_88037 [Hanseniaspora valbyensis NRRL Y-1626]
MNVPLKLLYFLMLLKFYLTQAVSVIQDQGISHYTSWEHVTVQQSANYERINLARCIEFNYNNIMKTAFRVTIYDDQGMLCFSIPDPYLNLTVVRTITFACSKAHHINETFGTIGIPSKYDEYLVLIGDLYQIGTGPLKLMHEIMFNEEGS